eukprot:CAMPEP_0184710500 /NCGR_PEP_ID=MMETSP0314-20130426/1273_1 /TAXON_ID=38298 /ORGANISM="Rhodella maculata, Strain CCMP 736" /LENGTH=167 /DNA_ID=CAMNT_0027172339 /DNA_START=74 /DNA_END=574 /DNA_ORIENTATION=+
MITRTLLARRVVLAAFARPSSLLTAPARGLAVLHTGKTVGELLDKAAKASPQKNAVKFYETTTGNSATWTYKELTSHVNGLVAGLHELSLKRGDIAVTLLPPGSAENFVVQLACARLGVAIAPSPLPASLALSPAALSALSAKIASAKPAALFLWDAAKVSGDEDAG